MVQLKSPGIGLLAKHESKDEHIAHEWSWACRKIPPYHSEILLSGVQYGVFSFTCFDFVSKSKIWSAEFTFRENASTRSGEAAHQILPLIALSRTQCNFGSMSPVPLPRDAFKDNWKCLMRLRLLCSHWQNSAECVIWLRSVLDPAVMIAGSYPLV